MVPTSSETETESDGHHERGARAVEDAREQVAAEIVGTEQVAGGRGGGAGRTQAQQQRLAQRVVVREQVGAGRGEDEGGEKREDDDDAGRKSARSSFEPDARVDDRIGDVGEQVHADIDDGNEQHDGLHDQEVARRDRLDGELADAGPGEHGLHDDGAGEQVADLECRDGDDRNGRIAQHVAQHRGAQ